MVIAILLINFVFFMVYGIENSLSCSITKLVIEKVQEASETQPQYLILKNVNKITMKKLIKEFRIKLNYINNETDNEDNVIVFQKDSNKIYTLEEFQIPNKVLITQINSKEEEE